MPIFLQMSHRRTITCTALGGSCLLWVNWQSRTLAGAYCEGAENPSAPAAVAVKTVPSGAQSRSFRTELAKLRRGEKEMRQRWIHDEEAWRKLPPRAWPEKQPNVEELPSLEALMSKECAAQSADSPSAACMDAKFDLGTCLIFNTLDVPRGLTLYKSLASAGNVKGMTGVGVVLVEGLGVNNDEAEGSKWIVAASDKGYSQAHFEMGTLLYTGAAAPHVKENVNAAFKQFEKAAALNHTGALYMTADMLYTGEGCEDSWDAGRAVRLLYQAGERGHRYARATLLEWLRDEEVMASRLDVEEETTKQLAAIKTQQSGWGHWFKSWICPVN